MSANEPLDRPLEAEGGDTASAPRRSPFAALRTLPGLVWSRYGLFFLALVAVGGLIYLAISGDGFIKHGELEREIQKLKAEIEVFQDDNRILRQKLERLKNDQAYIEDEARKKLGLVRPGEVVYRLSEEPDLGDERRRERSQPNVPEISPAPDKARRLALTLTAGGGLFFEGQPVTLKNLARDLERGGARGGEAVIVVSADEAVPHGRVTEIMDALRQGGFHRVVLTPAQTPKNEP